MFSPSFDKEKKLWYGPDIPALYNPHISIAQALLHSMSMFGSKIAEVILLKDSIVEKVL